MRNKADLTNLNLPQVVAHARDLLGTLKGARYKNAYDFVVREGEVFASEELTDTERTQVTNAMGRKQFQPKVCFFNAQRLVMADTSGELEYVEGYTTGLIHHAWVAVGPKVIDLTLRHANGGRPTLGGLPAGREYFGVRFGRTFLAAALKKRRVVNFLDDWKADFPVLQGVKGWRPPRARVAANRPL